ncbi:MAG: filamentous hemagglutinin N-terminal domain-containing protein, partial [Candidatus Omnitrophica bacterium]|nr:filamentous hemagglutinin N-terminal domain-containing protein [Candidatus Omnitrophota bacterium]
MKFSAGQRGSAAFLIGTALCLAMCAAFSVPSYAFDDSSYEVASGSASHLREGATITFTASENTIINFPTFNINENETVIFNVPSSDSRILTRVTGGSPSEIMGTLVCPGQFFHVNEAGIHIGDKATIDVASAVFSTRNISDSDFLSGNYLFKKMDENARDMLLLNRGQIKISNGGFGIFIAGAVHNEGLIVAPAGNIVLACGNAVRIGISEGGRIGVAIEEKVAATVYGYDGKPITEQIRNTGEINAAGGTIILKAESIVDIFEKAINLDGIV